MSNLLLKAPLVYEPKKVNRFILRFPSDLGIQEWTVKTASRPKRNQDETELPFLNTSTYVLGRYTWDPMEVTFLDFIGPSTAQAITEWARLHSEEVTGRQGYAAGYKRDVELEILDPTGVAVEKWVLKNTMLTNVDYGNLEYGSSDVLTITCTLRFDYAILVY